MFNKWANQDETLGYIRSWRDDQVERRRNRSRAFIFVGVVVFASLVTMVLVALPK